MYHTWKPSILDSFSLGASVRTLPSISPPRSQLVLAASRSGNECPSRFRRVRHAARHTAHSTALPRLGCYEAPQCGATPVRKRVVAVPTSATRRCRFRARRRASTRRRRRGAGSCLFRRCPATWSRMGAVGFGATARQTLRSTLFSNTSLSASIPTVADRLLPTAYCLLPTAYRLPPTAFCLWLCVLLLSSSSFRLRFSPFPPRVALWPFAPRVVHFTFLADDNRVYPAGLSVDSCFSCATLQPSVLRLCGLVASRNSSNRLARFLQLALL